MKRPFSALGIGWLLATIGLIVTIVLLLVGQLPLMPLGLLFILVFLAILL